jgi:hypothetical protein
MNSHTTTQGNSAAISEGDTLKKIEAFFTRTADKARVSLWITEQKSQKTLGSPDFDGLVDGVRVVARIRNGVNGTFMAINQRFRNPTDDAEGSASYREDQIGTANLVVNGIGMPRLIIKLLGNKSEPIWASVSKKVPDELLIRAGLSFETMAARRATRAEHRKLVDDALGKAPDNDRPTMSA